MPVLTQQASRYPTGVHQCQGWPTPAVCSSYLTDDVRVLDRKPLLSPEFLRSELPQNTQTSEVIQQTRLEASNIIHGVDDRLLVVVGPCSIHDPSAALEYACQLTKFKHEFKDDLLIVMRVYFEKPRTTVGWKGLINDPDLDGSFKINDGLRIARKLLLDINELGLPAGVEFLDTITPQYLSDLVSWGAIGARTTESQIHRELASGLSCPIGFKNGTSGNVQIAVDGVSAARYPHSFLGVTKHGMAAIVQTAGNPDCHIILRGGRDGPNCTSSHVKFANDLLTKAGLSPSVMIDCSHGNSNKDYKRQPVIASQVAKQVAAGEHIFGVMLESNLKEGRQNLPALLHQNELNILSQLEYGKSITDGCIDLQTTKNILEHLAESVKQRRMAFPL